MKDRVIRIPETINDIQPVIIERKVDFHVNIPVPLCEKLEKAAIEKGIHKSVIVQMALEVFLK